jgi:hypothetical protein
MEIVPITPEAFTQDGEQADPLGLRGPRCVKRRGQLPLWRGFILRKRLPLC